MAREKELVAVFKQRGLNVVDVNTAEFRDAVLKSVPFEQFGYQKGDFKGLLRAMDGLPVIIRLLDPPLHEFLPKYKEVLEE